MNIVRKLEQDDVALTVERLEHANINPKTMLATDYLNHFNEMIMLIDMLDSMPQCVDDILAWHPKGYRQHFSESVFAEKALAITAYDQAPASIRCVFEETIAKIDKILLTVQRALQSPSHPLPHADGALSALLSQDLRPLMDRASAIINGTVAAQDLLPATHAQDTVDALFSTP